MTNELNGSETVTFHKSSQNCSQQKRTFASSVNRNDYHTILNLNNALSSDLVIRKCFIIGSFRARENVSNQLHVYHL